MIHENSMLEKAGSDDLETLNKILFESKSLWGYDREFMTEFMKCFRITEKDIDNKTSWLLKIDNKNAGFVTLDFANPELVNFFIQPKFTGLGIGKFLWNEVIRLFSEKDIFDFKIWADPNANGFYEKMGSKVLETKLSPMGKDRMTNIYQYHINSQTH